MIPYNLLEHQTFTFTNVSYGSFSKESTIIWLDLVNATKRLTPGASSIPAQFSYFSFYYFEINFYFYKSIISIHCILSFASYHSSYKGSCFKLFKILFLVFSSIFLENTHAFLLLGYQLQTLPIYFIYFS